MNPRENDQKLLLAEIYATHHDQGGRLGFTFGGSAKGERFARWIGTGKDVLDIGCRDGTLTQFFVAGNTITGVDVDRQALRECEKKLGIATEWLDITSGLPFADSRFDVVVASEVLEHLPWPHIVVEEIARTLRKGGLFVGSVPNAFRLKNRLLFLRGIEYEMDPTHLRRFSARSLSSVLSMHFTDVQIWPSFSHLLWLSGRLFGNTLLWSCRKP